MKKPTQMLLKKKLEMNLAGVSTSLCWGRCGLWAGMRTISGSSELESAIGEVRGRCPSCLGVKGRRGEEEEQGWWWGRGEVFEEGESFFLCLPLGRLFERTVVPSTTYSLLFPTKIGRNN